MKMARVWALSIASCALAGPAGAHAVRPDIAVGQAVVVTLRYANGEPFAFERYELSRDQAGEPVQSGRTDALGQLALLPGDAGADQRWRLRAFSADGHGIDIPLQVAGLALHDGVGAQRAAPPAPAPVPGWERIALGGCVIFGLSLLLRHALRRRRSA